MEKLKELWFVVQNLRFFFKHRGMFRCLKSTMTYYNVLTVGSQDVFLKPPSELHREPYLQVFLYHPDDKSETLNRFISFPYHGE